MAYPGDYLVDLAKRYNRAELLKLYKICMSDNLSSPQGLRCLTFIHGLDWVKLPNETLTLIVEQCHLTDCLSLSLTSKRLNEAALPAIYRDVDLSIHNRGVFKLQPSPPDKYDSSSFSYTVVPANTLTRQERFLETLEMHPEYAVYIELLTWALLLLHAKFTMMALTGIHRQRKILKIWDIFQTLTQFKALDMAYLSSDHSHPLASQFPDALFPAATTIRISGVMHYSLAASIIAVDPSKLVHLTIDNLQQEGSQNDDSLFWRVAQRQAYHQQTLSSWNTLHQNYHNISPSTWLTGPMQNLLSSIAGRCPKLKSLTIRKVGQRH